MLKGSSITADVETEYDKDNGVGERKQSRIADGETEQTLLSLSIIVLGVGFLLVHAMDVTDPGACWQAMTSSTIGVTSSFRSSSSKLELGKQPECERREKR